MIKLEVPMIERNFAQQILFLPISNGADELRIISGYSTPNRIFKNDIWSLFR